MKLTHTEPVQRQIRHALESGKQLTFDLRGEAMGDKAAFTAHIKWLSGMYGRILVLECENGRTPFMLREYSWNLAKCLSLDPLEQHDGLDLCTTGTPLPSNWELHAYLAANGFRPHLDIEIPITGFEREKIVFAIRTGAKADQRKDMDLDRARQTIDELQIKGFQVEVLYDRQDSLFPEVKERSMEECIALIAHAKAFIGGDTGFSHVAAGFGIPQVALYPDYFRWGKASLSKSAAIAEWWGLKDMVWTPFNSLPNNAEMVHVELGTDHKWSIEGVIAALDRLQIGS